jgi:hypothetical protein
MISFTFYEQGCGNNYDAIYLIFVDILYCIVLEFKQTCVYSLGWWGDRRNM